MLYKVIGIKIDYRAAEKVWALGVEDKGVYGALGGPYPGLVGKS